MHQSNFFFTKTWQSRLISPSPSPSDVPLSHTLTLDVNAFVSGQLKVEETGFSSLVKCHFLTFKILLWEKGFDGFKEIYLYFKQIIVLKFFCNSLNLSVRQAILFKILRSHSELTPLWMPICVTFSLISTKRFQHL